MQTLGTEEPEITLPGKMWKRLRPSQWSKRVEAGGSESGVEGGGWGGKKEVRIRCLQG